MNRTLLPPRGAIRSFVRRVDDRGIPIPDWWTDDEDTSMSSHMLLSTKMRQGTLRR